MGDEPFDVAYAIGCDIGVTNVKWVCVARDGTVLAREMAETNAAASDWPEGVRAHVDRLERAHGRAAWVGIAAPGIAHPNESSIVWMQGRLDQVEGLNWTQFLGRGADVP